MNLRKAKEILITTQKTLGLDSCTTPESEFRAELYAIAQYIKSDCARISTPQTSTFCIPNQSTLPSTVITLTPDDTIDGLGPNVLIFTYFGGDETPAGPNHGLSITLNPISQLLYQRLPGQNPVHQWICNVWAQENSEFIFPPYISDQSWMDQAKYFNLIQKHEVAEFLISNDPAQFIVEAAYLSYWNTEHYNTPNDGKIKIGIDSGDEDMSAIITITCNNSDDIEPISLIYTFCSEVNDYSLQIIDGDNVVYQREAGQDPLTEWIINCIANDPLITDEHGNLLFAEEPVRQ